MQREKKKLMSTGQNRGYTVVRSVNNCQELFQLVQLHGVVALTIAFQNWYSMESEIDVQKSYRYFCPGNVIYEVSLVHKANFGIVGFIIWPLLNDGTSFQQSD